MNVKLNVITPDVEKAIVEIARVSSKRTDKREDPDKLINYLIKNQHWSPFEHGYMTLEIETSKAIGIQYLRHRSFTFQEFSQRYAKVASIEPIEIRKQAVKNRQSSTDVFDPLVFFRGEQTEASDAIQRLLNDVEELYGNLLEANVAKECARMILPMATTTTIFMTGPIRSWIHLINLRTDSHAQKEAQEIARAARAIFIEQCPIISKALGYV